MRASPPARRSSRAFRTKYPEAKPEHVEVERTRLARAPLVIAVVSRAGPHVKIPEWEQVLSAGAAAMSLVLAAHALGYAANWITEWYAYDRGVLEALGPQRRTSASRASSISAGRASRPKTGRDRRSTRSRRVSRADKRTRANRTAQSAPGTSMFYDTAKNDHGLPRDPFKAIVAPRPIGWITSMSANGEINLAPYSFFNAVSDDPPIVLFSSEGPQGLAGLRRTDQGVRLQSRDLSTSAPRWWRPRRSFRAA